MRLKNFNSSYINPSDGENKMADVNLKNDKVVSSDNSATLRTLFWYTLL